MGETHSELEIQLGRLQQALEPDGLRISRKQIGVYDFSLGNEGLLGEALLRGQLREKFEVFIYLGPSIPDQWEQ